MTEKEVMQNSFFEQLEAQRETDPMIGVKTGADEIFQRLILALKDRENKVNVDLLLQMASGLAGVACQYIGKQYASARTKQIDGKEYVYGAEIDNFLLYNEYSVYGMMAGIFKKLHPDKNVPLPDGVLNNLKKNSTTEGYAVKDLEDPSQYITGYCLMYKKFEPIIAKFCKDDDEIPILYALVLQKCINTADKAISYEYWFEFCLENAIYSSRQHLEEL